jgi:thiol-disulfide isomerase/thioredoxin
MAKTKLGLLALLAAALVVIAAGCGGDDERTATEEAAVGEQMADADVSSGTSGEGVADDSDEEAASRDASGADAGEADIPTDEIGVDDGDFPPPFALPDLEGNQVSLSDYRGKVVVLDLWATWCGPCRAEIPFLVELYEDLRDEGLVVVGVGLDRGGAGVLRPFVESNGVTYPILVGNPSIQQEYKVSGIPTTFILNREGRIVTKHVGYHPSMAEGLRAEIEGIVRGGAPQA